MKATHEIGKLLCRLHEDRITLRLESEGRIEIEGAFTDALFEEVRAAKPLLLPILEADPLHLSDDWRRLIYGDGVTIDQANDSNTSHTHGD